jgi:uncharacterized protein (DUF1800 family)
MRPAIASILVLTTFISLGGNGKELTKDERIVHAVERLTFGPRPGDIDRVRKQGLDRWIDDQLHPERIAENPMLIEKIKPLESLTMNGSELVRNYPPAPLVKAMYEGAMPIPAGPPLLRAALEFQIQRYRNTRGDKGEPLQRQQQPPYHQAREFPAILEPGQLSKLRQGTPEEKTAILTALPPDKADALLIALPQNMRRILLPVAPPEVRRKIVLLTRPQQVLSYDLNEAKLMRAIYSNHQLAELMADFWYNHFNVFLDKGADRELVTPYEREAIRPNVLGKFRTLLGATAKSPAMLFYLDNWQSVAAAQGRQNSKSKRGLNENYGRELLELHTLGVDGGYTQKDIVEVARCFTGWTIRAPRQGGEFFYKDSVHDKGEKIVLGVTIPAGGGEEDGERVLDILAAHPSTARFISRKLAERFVSDDPPAPLIDHMARTFRSSGGDIRQVLSVMIHSPGFFSRDAFQAKLKTPFEMTVSAVRALDARVDSAEAIAQRLNEMGQPLYRKVEPTGYSSKNQEWMNSSALLGRMNFALALAQGKLPGISVAVSESDPIAAARLLVPAPLSGGTRDTIAQSLADPKAASGTAALVAGLLLGSPEFQRR